MNDHNQKNRAWVAMQNLPEEMLQAIFEEALVAMFENAEFSGDDEFNMSAPLSKGMVVYFNPAEISFIVKKGEQVVLVGERPDGKFLHETTQGG